MKITERYGAFVNAAVAVMQGRQDIDKSDAIKRLRNVFAQSFDAAYALYTKYKERIDDAITSLRGHNDCADEAVTAFCDVATNSDKRKAVKFALENAVAINGIVGKKHELLEKAKAFEAAEWVVGSTQEAQVARSLYRDYGVDISSLIKAVCNNDAIADKGSTFKFLGVLANSRSAMKLARALFGASDDLGKYAGAIDRAGDDDALRAIVGGALVGGDTESMKLISKNPEIMKYLIEHLREGGDLTQEEAVKRLKGEVRTPGGARWLKDEGLVTQKRLSQVKAGIAGLPSTDASKARLDAKAKKLWARYEEVISDLGGFLDDAERELKSSESFSGF